MRKFCDLSDLDDEALRDLLQLADRLDRAPEPEALRGRVLALLFLSPSLRTLVSFQAAMARLGGGTFVISPEMSIHGLESRSGIVMDGAAAEHIREAVPVIASYADAIGVRAHAPRLDLDSELEDVEFHEIASLVDIPLINMESAISHPCQSLSDWKTLDDLGVPESGGQLVLSWVYHPQRQSLAVPASTLQMAVRRGMDVTILRPGGFELPEPVMRSAQGIAAGTGATIRETDDRRDALDGAHVIYARSWPSVANYSHDVDERELKADFQDWMIDQHWFDGTRDDCRLLHCMPVRRGVEVSSEVLDGPRSHVVQQARNRMVVQTALLHRFLR